MSYFFITVSGAEIGRFVAMLRNPSPTLKACAAFALLQASAQKFIVFFLIL